MTLSIEMYELASKLLKNEQYCLISQVTRCAVSIPSNIAEGKQRHNKVEFRHFIGIARGLTAELETQLIIIENVFGIDTKNLRMRNSNEEIQKILTTLAQKLKQ